MSGTRPVVSAGSRQASDRHLLAVLLEQAVLGLTRSPVRASVSVVVAAAAVALLLAGLSLGAVAQAREDRAAGRSPMPGGPAEGADLLYLHQDGYYAGRPVAAPVVAVRGDAAPVPPGLDELPGPGELAVSPAMRALLLDPSTSLADRYPGRITQIVGAEGLLGPDELVVWTGRSVAEMGPDAAPVAAFARPGSDGFALPAELRPAQALLVVGFLVPLLALLVTCATIGGAQRDQRLSALRLLGLTGGQTKLVTALEAGALAVAGVLVGTAVFAVLRAPIAPLLPVNGGVRPDDVPLSAATTAVLLVVLPAAAVLASLVAMRSVAVSPLAVVRRAVVPVPRRRRLLPLVVGAALLVAALPVVPLGVGVRSVLVVAGVGACTVGLVLGSAVVSHHTARLLERLEPSLGPALGLRQVSTGAVRAARTATGLACLVFVSGLLLSFFPLLADATAADRRDLARETGGSLLVASLPPGGRLDAGAVRAAPGVLGFAVLHQLPVRIEGTDASAAVLVVDCADLQRAMDVSRADCAGGLRIHDDGGQLPAGASVRAVRERVTEEGFVETRLWGPAFSAPRAPARSPSVEALAAANGQGASAAVPATVLPAEVAARLDAVQSVVVVRADPARLEAVRTAVVRASSGGTPLTTGESLAIAEKTTRTFEGLTLAAFGSAAVVAVLSLLVAAADQVREQRRVLLTLWVVGVPPGTLRRALLTRVAVSTGPALLASFCLAVLAATAFLQLADQPPALPWTQLGLVLAAALLAPFLAAACVLPLVRPGRAPNLCAP